jgi:formylglycine-generating enzyme required for sulfatase activity
MAPEVFEGKRTEQSDIWSTGAILYQLLVGRPPFPQESISESPAKTRREADPLPSDIPARIRTVVARALENNPEKRYASVADFREALLSDKPIEPVKVIKPKSRVAKPIKFKIKTGHLKYAGIVGVICITAAILLYAMPRLGSKEANKVNPVDGASMVWIPSGEFTMGTNAPPYNCDQEKPAHKVYLDGYYIYKTPVTVRQYRKFCNATNRAMPETPQWGWDNPDYPIVNVSWVDAEAYAKWAHAELPTEAQWEKAARGTDERKYPWGNEWDINRCASSVKPSLLKKPRPVGSYMLGASPYGALDMSGNVFQWCSDRYAEDAYSRTDNLARNPVGPASGENRVLRGESFIDGNVNYFRSTYRVGLMPSYTNYDCGFRCVYAP